MGLLLKSIKTNYLNLSILKFYLAQKVKTHLQVELKIQRKYSDNELIKLKELLNKTFRPIKKNDYFIAMKLKDKGIFYFKDEKVLETKDIDFLNLFFNIWLREDSEDPNFTKSLLGKDK